MKINFTETTAIIQSENVNDEIVLAFIKLLDEKKAFNDLMNTFADMVNKKILRVHNGQIIWNSEWTLIDEIPGYS